MVLRVPLQMHLFGPEWLQHRNIELLLWRFLARLACGRYYTTHWAVILLEILLLDIPRTVLGLHPVAEVLLHIFLLEWLCVVVRSEEAFLSIFSTDGTERAPTARCSQSYGSPGVSRWAEDR